MIKAQLQAWSEFWFTPSPIAQMQFVRTGLCAIAAIYFIASWGDVTTWLVADAPASSTNLAAFFRAADLSGEARWMISPLFVWDALFAGTSWAESALVYRGYLVVGILLACWVGLSDRLGRFGMPERFMRVAHSWFPGFLLWIWFVGWANRVVLLAGMVEPILSVSLAALAIAPVVVEANRVSWRTTLSRRLIAVQTTLIAVLTTATMLAAPTWWNGTGAYALAAPAEDRWISVRETWFEATFVFEFTTALLVVALPLGILFAWRTGTRRLGIGLVVVWCIVVGLLSSNVLYAATLAIAATTLGQEESVHTTAGASGA